MSRATWKRTERSIADFTAWFGPKGDGEDRQNGG